MWPTGAPIQWLYSVQEPRAFCLLPSVRAQKELLTEDRCFWMLLFVFLAFFLLAGTVLFSSEALLARERVGRVLCKPLYFQWKHMDSFLLWCK